MASVSIFSDFTGFILVSIYMFKLSHLLGMVKCSNNKKKHLAPNNNCLSGPTR